MAEIVNLRRARKARDRVIAGAHAAEKRVLYGRTRAEREASDARRDRERQVLDNAKLEGDGEPRE